MIARRLGIWLKRIVVGGAVVWTATFLAVFVYSAWPTTQPTSIAPADAIICLGAGMSPTEGWMVPDAATRRRAATCAQLYLQDAAPTIIFTGYGQHVSSAAAAMARVAAEYGVPPQAMVLEEDARSTIQNAAFSLPLLPPDASRVIVVTDRFHLPRAGLIFRALTDLELEMVPADTRLDGSHASGRSMLRWIAREAVAIWSNLARGAIYLVAGFAGVDTDTRIGWFN